MIHSQCDCNFHIYVHGNRNLLEQGEDEKGKFYKVYYQEEEYPPFPGGIAVPARRTARCSPLFFVYCAE